MFGCTVSLLRVYWPLLRAGLLPILVMDCYWRTLDRDLADEVLTLAFPAPSLVVDVTLTNVIAFLGLFVTL